MIHVTDNLNNQNIFGRKRLRNNIDILNIVKLFVQTKIHYDINYQKDKNKR